MTRTALKINIKKNPAMCAEFSVDLQFRSNQKLSIPNCPKNVKKLIKYTVIYDKIGQDVLIF